MYPKMASSATVSLALLLLGITVWSQPTPHSPCPQIFKYQFNGVGWYGTIELSNGIVFGGSNLLTVKLAYSVILRTSFLGSLELQQSREETIKKILIKQPIKYVVKFPIQSSLPKVVNIALNDKVICRSQHEIGSVHMLTYINLQHTLYTQLAAQKLAAATVAPAKSESLREPVSSDDTENDDDYRESFSAEDCGQIEPKFFSKPLIVGGETIPRGSWPWLTAIYLNLDGMLSFVCGGNLISTKAVLTSAHCFEGKHSIDDYIILLGRHDISHWSEEGSIARSIDDVFYPVGYSPDQTNFDADIAIVSLRNAVRFTDIIKPVCLPTRNQRILSERGVVVGWGRNQNKRVSTEPKRVEVTIVSDVVCLRSNSQFRILTSNRTFCAGNRDGSGPCSGDSGGGLMVHKNSRWTIVGLVSAALSDPNKSICDLNEYVIYADVRKFLDWIYDTLELI